MLRDDRADSQRAIDRSSATSPRGDRYVPVSTSPPGPLSLSTDSAVCACFDENTGAIAKLGFPQAVAGAVRAFRLPPGTHEARLEASPPHRRLRDSRAVLGLSGLLLSRRLSCVAGRELLAGEFCSGPTSPPSSSRAITALSATKEKLRGSHPSSNFMRSDVLFGEPPDSRWRPGGPPGARSWCISDRWS
jgi:hypothetical protein